MQKYILLGFHIFEVGFQNLGSLAVGARGDTGKYAAIVVV